MCSIRPAAGASSAVFRGRLLLLVAGLTGLGGAAVGCSSGGAREPLPDAAVVLDGSAWPADAASSGGDASGVDLGATDLAAARADLTASVDLLTRSDLALTPDLATVPDLAFPTAQGVDIYVDNFCKMDVVPKSIDVPGGVTLKLTFYNRSHDYPVDVAMSYIGGYTDLMTGRAWADPIDHCRTPRPTTEYADIITACSRYRMMIHCL